MADEKPRKKSQQQTAEQVDQITFGIIKALLKNPNIYPVNTDSAIIKMAIRIRVEMIDEGLIS